MGKAFYRKYRSKSLSDVVGQKHITDTLENALKSEQISHAYLFTGPHGVGKTSVARILAHQINEIPYSDDSLHLDIIEIDAASNRRIDEIRDLKDKVHIAPTSSKYKVYIIDEVHMLTKEAFNALLKTLEEPPKHVVFILATTEAHKLPDTIISRTQRHTFKPVSRRDVIGHLKYIAKLEEISIDDSALGLLAEHGGGSFRDSISLLDQMRTVKEKIGPGDIETALGIAPKELVKATYDAVLSRSKPSLDKALSDIHNNGVNIVQFSQQLSQLIRADILKNEVSEESLELLEKLARVGAHPDPSLALTIAVYQPVAMAKAPDQIIDTPQKATSSSEPVDSEPIPEHNEPALDTQDDIPSPAEIKPDPKPEPSKDIPAPDRPSIQIEPSGQWKLLLTAVKARHNTIYGIVRMAEPEFTDDTLTLHFSFPFHLRRMNDDKNKRLIEEVIEQAFGKKYRVIAVGAKKKSDTPEQKPKSAPKEDALKNVSNIFGGAEIVNS
jgi:DNA polymerase-3 subunit gamma/tau